MLSVNEAGLTSVQLVRSETGGESFEPPQELDDSGRVFSHLTPVWIDTGLVWARLNESGTVAICHWDGQATDCVDIGAERIDGLAGVASEVWVSTPNSSGEWTVTEVNF